MNTLLDQLELQVSTLMETCQRLSWENSQLKEKHSEALQEKDKLVEKNRLAADKIKQLLQTLKSIAEETHE